MMNRSTVLRKILLAPPSLRVSLLPFPPRTFTSALPRNYASSPSVTQKSFWVNLIPKPIRRSSPTSALKKTVKSKEWNPATFFIIIFLLVGSMSIQMITLRNEFGAFTRRADARIGLLKEIIEKIQNGEEVDVEGLLGTGDKEREKEWEEVLREIEQEDMAWENSRKQKPKHGRNAETESPPPVSSQPPKIVEQDMSDAKPKPKGPVGFY